MIIAISSITPSSITDGMANISVLLFAGTPRFFSSKFSADVPSVVNKENFRS